MSDFLLFIYTFSIVMGVMVTTHIIIRIVDHRKDKKRTKEREIVRKKNYEQSLVIPGCEWQQTSPSVWKLYSSERDCWIATINKTSMADIIRFGYGVYELQYNNHVCHDDTLDEIKAACAHLYRRSKEDEFHRELSIEKYKG